MSEDPYRPPEAPVQDVGPNSTVSAPLPVANAIRLLWIDVWLTVIYFGWVFSTVPPAEMLSTLISAVIGIGISVFLVLMLRDRRNWARYITLLLVALSLVSGLSFPEGTAAMEYIFFFLMLVVEILAVVLLFSKPSQRWFSAKR